MKYWTVILTGTYENRRIAYNIYGQDYFPRKFHYKREAKAVEKKLDAKGVYCNVVKT